MYMYVCIHVYMYMYIHVCALYSVMVVICTVVRASQQCSRLTLPPYDMWSSPAMASHC